MIGIGKKTTPAAFVKACEVFIYTENLKDEMSAKLSKENPVTLVIPTKPAVSKPIKTLAGDNIKKASQPVVGTVGSKEKLQPPLKMLQRAFTMTVQEDGWANLSAMGERLRRIDPAFDPRTWGYSQLSLLINAVPDHFQCKRNKSQGPGSIYVKLKSTM
jgi:hypothetical protein